MVKKKMWDRFCNFFFQLYSKTISKQFGNINFSLKKLNECKTERIKRITDSDASREFEKSFPPAGNSR